MRIIKLTPGESGAYPPIQSWGGETPPEGYAEIPDDLDVSAFCKSRGFVRLEISDGVVSKLDTNEETLAAWQASQPQPEEAEPEVSTEELVLETLAEQEARICAIELGV